MEIPKEPQETFTINVQILGEGINTELDVIPGENNYLILLDGVELSTVEYSHDRLPHWQQVEGNLDYNAVFAIGEAIESKLM